jgi:hypothetical protein
VRVLVLANLARDTRFASAAGSFLVGTTCDLVEAKVDGRVVDVASYRKT